jgi:hypothetical protein
MSDPNPYQSPAGLEQSRLEPSAIAIATLIQTRPAAVILCIVAGLIGLHRIGVIIYVVLRFSLVKFLYAGRPHGMLWFGTDMACNVAEAVLYFLLCRSLLAYMSHTRAIQRREETNLTRLFTLLKSIWNNLAMLAGVIALKGVETFVFQTLAERRLPL